MDIIMRITSCYPNLSKSQKKIADFIISNPESACFASLKEFTDLVCATEVTVVNFAKKIGLESFVSLKKELQAYIRMKLSPNDKVSKALEQLSVRDSILDDYIENEQVAIAKIFNQVSAQNIKDCVNYFRNSRHIYVVGHDSSATVAQFLLMRLNYLGITARSLDIHSPSDLLLTLDKSTKEDVFVIISFPQHQREMINLSKIISGKDIPLIAITDSYSSELNLSATLQLMCPTGDLLFYNSITATISLINYISTLLAVDTHIDLEKTRKNVQQLSKELYESK